MEGKENTEAEIEEEARKMESVFGVCVDPHPQANPKPVESNIISPPIDSPRMSPVGERANSKEPPGLSQPQFTSQLASQQPSASKSSQVMGAMPAGAVLPGQQRVILFAKERKIEGFTTFKDWNKKTRAHLGLVYDILLRMFQVYQRKNQRNENRLNFVKAFFNSFIEDMSKFSHHQLEFAGKAIHSFEAKDQQSMPIFEQGIYEMLSSIKSNEKRLHELKVYFDKKIFEPMLKSLTKHAEFYQIVEKISKSFDSFVEIQDRAAKEYDQFVAVFNNSMDLKAKKADKDVFTEAHKFCQSIRELINVLGIITDELAKLRPYAVAKENEYLKAFSFAFKQFGLFTQENFGNFMSATLSKSKFIFEVIDQKYSVESDYKTGNLLTPEDILKLNASKEMLNHDAKYLKTYLFDGFGTGLPEDSFLVYKLPVKVSVGSFISSVVQSRLFVTLDQYIIIMGSEDDKVIAAEKIEAFKPEQKTKDHQITLNYVKKGMIFDSNKEVRLLFDTPQQVEFFREVFSQITAKK